MEYSERQTFNLTNLNHREMSVIQAGLVLLANGATYGSGNGYAEYRKDAAGMLKAVNPPQSDDR